MNDQRAIFSPYMTAISYLPEKLRLEALNLSENLQNQAEEIRLRCGSKMTALIGGQETDISEKAVNENDLARLIENATGSSVHSFAETIKNGFIPMRGGHRLGLCGAAVMKNGEIATIRSFSSLNLRIAREHTGISDSIIPELIHDGTPQNTLIVSPPGFGKTTLLRDIIRNLSKDFRIGVVDERCEIGGSFMCRLQFDLGSRTDILESCSKPCGIPLLIKSMSPQIVCVDEITSEADVRAIESAMCCGVSIIATAHAYGLSDFKKRPIYSAIRRAKIFTRLVTVQMENGQRKYTVESAEPAPASRKKAAE